jgi:hypothetical protein
MDLTDAQVDFKFAFEGGKSSGSWPLFIEVVDPKRKLPFIACKACKWVTPHPNSTKRYSTSKMRPHLDECGAYQARNKKRITDHLIAQAQRPYLDTTMTSTKLTERVMNAAVQSNLSWNSATNPAWCALFQEAWPDVKVPDRRSLPALLEKKAKEARSDLKARLGCNESKVSLALDGWSANSTSYQGTIP